MSANNTDSSYGQHCITDYDEKKRSKGTRSNNSFSRLRTAFGPWPTGTVLNSLW